MLLTRVKRNELLNFDLTPVTAGVPNKPALRLKRRRRGKLQRGLVGARFGVRRGRGRTGERGGCLARQQKMLWRGRQHELAGRAGVDFHLARGGAVRAVGLGGAGGEAAQRAGRRRLAKLRLFVFLRRHDLHLLWALVFVAGLAEEEQLLVVFPFGHVEFVRRPASLDRLVLPVENCAEVLELALYVVNCEGVRNTVLFLRFVTGSLLLSPSGK